MAAKHIFARFATAASEWTGKPLTFVLAVALVVSWAVTGPLFDFSETWQLVINTGTTIVTFLMVFVLQNAQSRDTRAIQAKLDELILTSHAENRFIGIEHLDEEDLKHLDRIVAKAAKGRRAEIEESAEQQQTSPRKIKQKRKTAPEKAPS
ncbi:low affinity iron permease family protein [Rhizobium grahamii]|uniref:Low affinity iron permease family protein n=1 Tax=Rhizobium grahamii TaxID=1120045 RepID=A0A5Q0C977_9HYPH|nr:MULTISPECIES: low affinity iron permease family protein [Rhizobium]QFY60229.1 low affinity iron permease family protein [Rhizobium grahamii]QRM50649.1 low affinity iron permease family protein [Rhizobium sp. BG6]